MTQQGQEREYEISEEQESRIADAAAERIKEWLYVELGKATFRAIVLLAGAVGAGAIAWFGFVKEALIK